MSRHLEFTVPGVPAPQGSKSARSICGQSALVCPRCRRPHLVRINQVEASRALRGWRDTVTMAARVAMAAHGRREPMAGAVLLHVTFTFARPRSHYRAGKSAHLLKPGVPARPAGPPDLSKLVRAVEDALTDAGVWKDDAQVTDTSSRKTYAGTGFGALGGPGAAIAVTEIAALTPG